MSQSRNIFKNGVRVVQERMPQSRSVSFGIWMGVGSSKEERTLSGISHFVEHMMFKGTKKMNATEIAETIDRVGGELGAFTSREYTCFYTKVRDCHVSIAVELLADMFFNSLFEAEQIEKEKRVIKEEIKMYEDTPDELIHDLFIQKIWDNHSLGQPVLGTKEAIDRINRESIKNFIGTHYSPECMILSFAGALDEEENIRIVERMFSDFTTSANAKKDDPPSCRQVQWSQRRPLEQVHVCIGTEALAYAHKDRYTLYLLNAIMGGSMSSRLFQRIREQRALAYAVYSYQICFASTGLFVVYIGTSANNYREVVQITLEEFFKIREKGVDDTELAKAKEQVKGNLVLRMEDTSNRMSRLAKLELYFKEVFDLDYSLKRIDDVRTEDVRELASSIFKKESIGIVSIGPIKRKDQNAIFL